MKKPILRALALLTAALSLGLTACGGGHTHAYTNKSADAQFLVHEANCQEATTYYYSCSCGKAGDKTFSVGSKTTHDFSAEIVSEEYLKKPATCLSGGEYYKSCVSCGQKTHKTFMDTTLGDHVYDQENTEGKFLKDEATFTQGATYYKSCVCGIAGTETFIFGEPLRVFTESEKIPYTPISLTVTLFDPMESVYGFTYNTQSEPLRPVIQVAEGNSFTNYTEYPAKVEKESSYDDDNKLFIYYIVKAEVDLEPSKTYTYRAYDKYADIGTETVTFQTKDPTATAFTFAHISDSQEYPVSFGTTLSNLVNYDFAVHTGDVVESSNFESEWKSMLHNNFAYLSKIPVMAISGNHETTYKNGDNETYKHFHNNMPAQSDTHLGYYYSFSYGNAKFIMLNTNRLSGDKLTGDQYSWLVNELSNNTAEWTFVAMHNPMYSAGTYGSDPSRNSISRKLREQLQDIFVEYGVDVVLQGHDHLVSRTHPINANGEPTIENWETVNGVEYSVKPNGVVYIMSGTAGSQTRSPNSYMDSSYYKIALSSKASSWTEFSIDGNRLIVRMNYTQNGEVKEYAKWGIRK